MKIDVYVVQGIALALGNGLICLLLPTVLSWSQRKWKQKLQQSIETEISSPELASQEAH